MAREGEGEGGKPKRITLGGLGGPAYRLRPLPICGDHRNAP